MKLVLARHQKEQSLMKRIKAKEELFKKAQDLDERKIDMNAALAEAENGLELRLDDH